MELFANGDVTFQTNGNVNLMGSGELQVNGQRVITEADSTDSADGPGSHSHGLS